MDEFEGGSENTSHGSLPSLPSHLGIKPEENSENDGSEKFTNNGKTSHQDQDSMPKSEQGEQIATGEQESRVGATQAQNNDKGEQCEVSKINVSSHPSQGSPSSHIESIANHTHFECFTCNTGLRGMDEVTKLSGNIYQFHVKLNHKTKRYTTSEAKEIEERNKNLFH